MMEQIYINKFRIFLQVEKNEKKLYRTSVATSAASIFVSFGTISSRDDDLSERQRDGKEE